jgi:GTP-binding protein EngB required for normal cell division
MAQYLYENAVKQLQESGSISLEDFKNLPYEDLTELLEEIKVWCLYANGKADKLPKDKKEKKKKKKKD